MLNVKYYLRKNKVLSSVLKPIYRQIMKLHNIPTQKRAYEDAISMLNSVDQSEKKIWYFGVPTHSNLGDQAQKYCITKWLETNYPDCRIVKISSDAFNYRKNALLESIKNLVDPDDLMVMQSGYTFDGLHPDEQAHKLISDCFPDNGIVFFPQTILYKTEKRKAEMSRSINNHRKTLLLTRDRISYESALGYYPNVQIELFPDIVTTLIGTQKHTSERDGILLCVRNDGEKLYSDADIAALTRSIQKYGRVDVTDTSNMDMESLNNDNVLWDNISRTVKKYSQYRAIVTDRYHGTIFSLVAGTPVIVLKTTDHKVVTGAEWFIGVYDEYVSCAQSPEHAKELLDKLLTARKEYALKPYFKENYYDNLKARIDKLLQSAQ